MFNTLLRLNSKIIFKKQEVENEEKKKRKGEGRRKKIYVTGQVSNQGNLAVRYCQPVGCASSLM